MKREFTNIIRALMDNLIPAVVRDNKYFMFPFYFYAYRGKNIHKVMNFKSIVKNMSASEYTEFYSSLNSISRNRKTDLTERSIRLIHNSLDKTAKNLIDIGCGNGFLLKTLADKKLSLHGLDVAPIVLENGYKFHTGNLEMLPFADQSFDIVICAHTLEHVLNLNDAVSELKRVARKQLIIIVPCQKKFYYTLDEHVNFFQNESELKELIGIKESICKKVWGDLIYIANLKN